MSDIRVVWEETGDALYRSLALRLLGGHHDLMHDDRTLVWVEGLGPYGRRAIHKVAVWAVRINGGRSVLDARDVESAKRAAVDETLRHMRRELADTEKIAARLRIRIAALETMASLP